MRLRYLSKARLREKVNGQPLIIIAIQRWQFVMGWNCSLSNCKLNHGERGVGHRRQMLSPLGMKVKMCSNDNSNSHRHKLRPHLRRLINGEGRRQD